MFTSFVPAIMTDEISTTDAPTTGLVNTGPQPTTTSSLSLAANGGQKVRKIVRKKRRPARPQVDPATFKSEPPPQTGVTFKYVINSVLTPYRFRTDSFYLVSGTTNGVEVTVKAAKQAKPMQKDAATLPKTPAIRSRTV